MAKGCGLVQELLSSHYSVDGNSLEHSITGPVRAFRINECFPGICLGIFYPRLAKRGVLNLELAAPRSLPSTTTTYHNYQHAPDDSQLVPTAANYNYTPLRNIYNFPGKMDRALDDVVRERVRGQLDSIFLRAKLTRWASRTTVTEGAAILHEAESERSVANGAPRFCFLHPLSRRVVAIGSIAKHCCY
jgi:hypothetical protein